MVAERDDVIPVLAEVFRTYGYAGASLALIGEHTKLGKGSLYHFFPGGKEDMAAAVLAQIDDWFCQNVFIPLREQKDAHTALREMFARVTDYFQSGQRICLVGAFALLDERDRFASVVSGYFGEWCKALSIALIWLGHGVQDAELLAQDTVCQIQGALVLARAMNEPARFVQVVGRCQQRLLAAHPSES